MVANTAKFITGTTVSAITGSSVAISAGAFMTNTAPAVDISATNFPLVKLELRVTLNTPSLNQIVNLYMTPIGMDDTNYPEAPDASWGQYYRASFPIKDNTTGEQMCVCEGVPAPIDGKFKPYLENGSTVATGTGWDLDLVDYSYTPSTA